MRVLQFLAVRSPGATARLARQGAHPAVSVILDLEDGLWDPLSESRTADLKAEGRDHLVAMARQYGEQLRGVSLGVRINRLRGSDGERDVAALGRLAGLVALDHVVATKVESAADLVALAADLRAAGVRYGDLVPIVETRQGIASLGEILDEARRLDVRWLVYGHFDYALDMGWWPFPGTEEPAYWDAARPVIAATEAAGIGHVHPPFFGLGDAAAFGRLARKVAGLATREFGMITIGREQTAQAAALKPDDLRHESPAVDGDAVEAHTPAEDPDTLGARIVTTYLANRRDDVSFVIDPVRRDFISPHLFLAARAHMARSAARPETADV